RDHRQRLGLVTAEHAVGVGVGLLQALEHGAAMAVALGTVGRLRERRRRCEDERGDEGDAFHESSFRSDQVSLESSVCRSTRTGVRKRPPVVTGCKRRWRRRALLTFAYRGRAGCARDPDYDSTMQTTPRRKILVVDDDLRLRDLLKRYLSDQGFAVDTVPDAAAMDRSLARTRYDLLVLDLMLPGEDGLAVCRRLRAAQNALPIIMLTAKGDDVDRIVGLEMGADDYLAKPFN